MDTIYVTGHRNPDTDSIVAAMAYAALRNALGDRAHAAAAPPLAPALPPAPPGRPPGSGLARQPAPGLPPHAASRGGRTRGAPGRSPR